MTMECTTVAGAGDAVCRKKDGDCLLSEALEVWPNIIVEIGFLVGRTKQQEGGKTPCTCVLKYRG